MTKREIVLQLADTGEPGPFTPAAFFLHFPPGFKSGKAAVQKHIDYFRATGNDIMKIQFEHNFPPRDGLTRPEHWADIPRYGEDFFSDPLDIVTAITEALKQEAVVVVTLYSAFMFAHHITGRELLVRHLEEDPHAVAKGLDTITESMLTFIRGCLDRGLDGFYVSTQGGEVGTFSDPEIFDTFIRPLEMRVWDEVDAAARMNILHVCDYAAPYSSLESFAEYPGQIVSAPLQMADRKMTGAEVATVFGRPFLGGMERLGAVSTGPKDAVEEEARAALDEGPPAMILGADCTLAADADWGNIAAAVNVAHNCRPG